MLCILQGKEKIKDKDGSIISQGRDAGKIQTDIHAQIGQCEHDPTIQHKKEGCNVLTLKKETLVDATKRIKKEHTDKHLPFDPTTVVETDCQTSTVREKLSTNSREVFISPLLKKKDGSPVVIDDFPDNHAFGNGVTANSRVKLKDGTELYFTWCVLPEGTVLSNAQKTKLCSICED